MEELEAKEKKKRLYLNIAMSPFGVEYEKKELFEPYYESEY